MKHTNFMLLDEDPDPGGDSILAELEEAEVNAGKVIETSLYTLSSTLQRKTIILYGQMGGRVMHILVDKGSSDSYIHSDHAQNLALNQQQVALFSVIFANSSTMTGNSMYSRVKWEIQGHKFYLNLRSMNVGVWDMVLGVEWMTAYSPITFDFQQMSIQLVQDGEQLLLHDCVENPELMVVRGKAMKEIRKVQSVAIPIEVVTLAGEIGNSTELPVEIATLLE